MQNLRLPLIAVLLAVTITSIMDFTGYTMFSALPLILIIIVFVLIHRQTKLEFGLRFGAIKHYALALAYPAVVLGIIAIVAYSLGEFSFEKTDWKKTIINIILGSVIGSIMLIITEEGFFRGWLWASFIKSKISPKTTLIGTTILFTIWHISAVVSDAEFGLPLKQIPIFLINVFILGAIWGIMRHVSNSVLVTSVSHAVWNAFAYELFGFGEKVGALGIENTVVFGPEVGYLGLALNAIFLLWIWRKYRMEF